MVALAGQVNGQTQKVPTFKPSVEIGVGSFPWGITAADALGFEAETPDLDGYPDIAVAVGQLNLYNGSPQHWTGNPGEIRVFRNRKNWTNPADALELAQIIPLIEINTNTVAADVAWADMNGDGRPDLVVTGTTHFDSSEDPGAWGVYVYEYQNGSFVFGDYEPTTYPVRGLTIADFDNDGDLDVAAAVDLLDIAQDRNYISILKNDGTGNLLPEALHGLGSNDSTMEVVSGLFDKTPGGGSLPDLFTSRWVASDGASLTNLDGTNYSQTLITSCLEWFFTDLVAGKFTSGKITDDIAAVSGAGLLYMLHGDGNGGFNVNCGGEPNDVYLDGGGAPLTFIPTGVAIGTLNGGTKPDLAVVRGHTASEGARVTILLGNGDGTLQFVNSDPDYHPALGALADRPFRVVITDLDQDGFGDIVTSNHGDSPNDVGTISVLINKFMVSTTP